MKGKHHKHGALAIVVLALLLALLLAPAAAPATTSHVTIHGHLMDLIWPGTPYFPPAPHYDYTDYIGYGQLESATGPDGGAFLGFLYARLDGTIGGPGDPNAFGNNTHSGGVVILSTLITDWQYLGGPFPDLDPDFAGNMDRYEEYQLWTGKWEEGLTHNNHNHQATLSLDGCNTLEGWHADLEWNSMIVDPSLGRAPFVFPLVTPANITGWVTTP